MNNNQVILGYWDFRGLGEPLKTALEYLNIPYIMELYSTDSEEEWFQKKEQAEYLFPNLPYLIDGDKTITESEAILVHICLKAGRYEMLGKHQDRVEFIQFSNIIYDIYKAFTRPLFDNKTIDSFKNNISSVVNEFQKKLTGLNEALGKREWLLGYLTYLDFILGELIERLSQIDEEIGTEITRDYPNLIAHMKRFVEIPRIREYRQSERFKARPHNAHLAIWK